MAIPPSICFPFYVDEEVRMLLSTSGKERQTFVLDGAQHAVVVVPPSSFKFLHENWSSKIQWYLQGYGLEELANGACSGFFFAVLVH